MELRLVCFLPLYHWQVLQATSRAALVGQLCIHQGHVKNITYGTDCFIW